MVRRTPAALLAVLSAAFAFLTAGCSHMATTSSGDDELVSSDDALTVSKVDEADIGVAGPAQIEDAIEALDAQTRSSRPLVTELGANAAALPQHDLFERIRKGFALTDVARDEIDTELNWYVSHPAYLDRTFKRGERYLYHIVQELEARKMPLELALLPVVESAFNPVAYSRARAAGLWQFIPATGKRYGLKQNWYYDGRRDVVAATRAALDYLEFLAAEFDGDWLLAIAAYNCGELNVERAIARNKAAGKPTDFFSLSLPRETRAYVPKLLAMSRIVNDPASHGLAFASIPNEPYFAQVDVAGQIDLNVAADLAELSKDELLALNPAFNHWVTDPDGPFHLLVPVDRETRLRTAIAALPAEKRLRVVYHRVRRGDTLGGIAAKYGVSVAELKATNRMRGTLIHPGQDLLVKAAPRGSGQSVASDDVIQTAAVDRPTRRAKSKHVVRQGDSLWGIARQYGVSLDQLTARNDLDSDSTLSVGQVLYLPGGTATLASTNPQAVSSTTYVVKRGDTLGRIASRFRVTISDLLGWNRLKSTSVIKPGQRLVMYRGDRRAGI